MNSVSKHLSAQTIAATLIAMRSGRKEVFLVVEGSSDIYLYSNVFAVPRSNFVSCGGKEILKTLYDLVPVRGLDMGTIFIRDRDHDEGSHSESNSVLLLKTDFYDIEMHLLDGRIFKRMFEEYVAHRAANHSVDVAYEKIVGAAAKLGALRLFEQANSLGLKFAGLEFTFVDPKSLNVDEDEMVRKVLARSHVNQDVATVCSQLNTIRQGVNTYNELASGKDVLEVMHIAFHRHYKCCTSAECSPDVLAKVLRIAAVFEDLISMSLIKKLSSWLDDCPFIWPGAPLAEAA